MANSPRSGRLESGNDIGHEETPSEKANNKRKLKNHFKDKMGTDEVKPDTTENVAVQRDHIAPQNVLTSETHPKVMMGRDSDPVKENNDNRDGHGNITRGKGGSYESELGERDNQEMLPKEIVRTNPKKNDNGDGHGNTTRDKGDSTESELGERGTTGEDTTDNLEMLPKEIVRMDHESDSSQTLVKPVAETCRTHAEDADRKAEKQKRTRPKSVYNGTEVDSLVQRSPTRGHRHSTFRRRSNPLHMSTKFLNEKEQQHIKEADEALSSTNDQKCVKAFMEYKNYIEKNCQRMYGDLKDITGGCVLFKFLITSPDILENYSEWDKVKLLEVELKEILKKESRKSNESMSSIDRMKLFVNQTDFQRLKVYYNADTLKDPIDFTYCPEEGYWYWSSDGEHWMRDDVFIVHGGVHDGKKPQQEDIERLQKLWDFDAPPPEDGCYICDLNKSEPEKVYKEDTARLKEHFEGVSKPGEVNESSLEKMHREHTTWRETHFGLSKEDTSPQRSAGIPKEDRPRIERKGHWPIVSIVHQGSEVAYSPPAEQLYPPEGSKSDLLKSLSVCVVGRPGAGKSSFINTILEKYAFEDGSALRWQDTKEKRFSYTSDKYPGITFDELDPSEMGPPISKIRRIEHCALLLLLYDAPPTLYDFLKVIHGFLLYHDVRDVCLVRTKVDKLFSSTSLGAKDSTSEWKQSLVESRRLRSKLFDHFGFVSLSDIYYIQCKTKDDIHLFDWARLMGNITGLQRQQGHPPGTSTRWHFARESRSAVQSPAYPEMAGVPMARLAGVPTFKSLARKVVSPSVKKKTRPKAHNDDQLGSPYRRLQFPMLDTDTPTDSDTSSSKPFKETTVALRSLVTKKEQPKSHNDDQLVRLQRRLENI